MRAFFIYLSILAGVVALALSSSVKMSEWVRDTRTNDLNRVFWWAEQVGKWGDLTNMSYLGIIDRFCEPNTYNFVKPTREGETNIDLYLYGDSYVRDIPKHAFKHVNEFHFIARIGSFDFQLNTSKRNILVLELSERYLRGRFKDTAFFDCIRIHKPGQQIPDNTAPNSHTAYTQATRSGIGTFFNPHINQNLEYHLFNYGFLLPARQIKAAINYKWFNRASGDVVISDDGNYLFFKPTVGAGPLSSYSPLKKHEVDNLVRSLNAVYDHYKKAGFDEVYFSVIPNTASILQPGYYNQAIPFIQNDLRMKMPCIDVYSIFKHHSNPAIFFRAGDTHWNNTGMQEWLLLVNNILANESNKAITGNQQ